MTPWHEWRNAPPSAEFAVIGDPVAHSWSPRIHRAAFRALGWSYAYEAIRVPEDEFDDALAWLTRLGYRGLNVTLPLKACAARWADAVDEPSAALGALNTLCLPRSRGTNTDGPGFLDVLTALGIQPPGPVLLLGAGGTARTLAVVLARSGYEVRVWNRTRSRAEEMAAQVGLSALILDTPSAAGCGLVVDATSAGLRGEAPPVDWAGVAAGGWALAAAYGEAAAPFLANARQAGLQAVDGRAMLVAQAARSFEWWHGVPAPMEALRALA